MRSNGRGSLAHHVAPPWVRRVRRTRDPAPAKVPAGAVSQSAAVPAPGQLEITFLPRSDRTLEMIVAGEIDLTTSAQLRGAICIARARRPRRLILDLSGVTFADAHLAHALAEADATMRRCRVVVVGARPRVRRMLGAAGGAVHGAVAASLAGC